jgi:hypothetical protein
MLEPGSCYSQETDNSVEGEMFMYIFTKLYVNTSAIIENFKYNYSGNTIDISICWES